MVTIYKILDEEKKLKKYGYNGYLSSDKDKILKKISDDETVKFEEISEKEYKEKFKDKTRGRIVKKIALGVAGATLLTIGTPYAIKALSDLLNKEITEDEFEHKTIDELIEMLKDENQKEAFTKMCNVQNHFNNVAAPSIKIDADENAQLYLTAEEVIALYTYGNADTLSYEQLGKIIGQKYLNINLLDKYTTAAEVMNTYYRYASKASGLSELFEDGSNQELFEGIENLLIEYNNTKDDKVKERINEELGKIYMSGEIDSKKDTEKEAASFIATLIVPSLYERNIIDEEMAKIIIGINQTITCNDLSQEITKSKDKANSEKDALLTAIVNKMNKEYKKSKNREINESARESKKLAEEEKSEGYFNGATNITKNPSKIKKEEAIKQFGKDAVSKAEEDANKKFEEEYAEKNEKQKAYGQGLSDGYALTYERTFDAYINSGIKLKAEKFSTELKNKINSYKGNYLDEYKKGLTEGAATGISEGINDAQQAKDDMEKFDNKKPTQVVEEERVTETSKEEPTKKPVVETKPEEPKTEVPTTEENTKVTITDDFIIVEEVEEERVYGDEEAPVRIRK